LTREVTEPVVLSVRSELPPWLEGALLRTGPSKFEVGAESYNHWFDGLAMLHRFAFDQGRVSYSNRFLQSNAFRAAERKQSSSDQHCPGSQLGESAVRRRSPETARDFLKAHA
jgi:carotenoid cleavage dioxygenase-like enzyme